MPSFIEPVALIGWMLLALSLWLTWRRPRPGAHWAAAAATLLYFAVATPLGANLAVGFLERAAVRASECELTSSRENLVVVLAGGMRGSPVSDTEISRLKEASLRRTLEAVNLARQLAGSRLVFVGGAGRQVREADLMGALARALGIPAERVMVERESESTFENAQEIARLVGKMPETGAIYLVTSAVHMPRALAAFRHQGLEVCAYPVDYTWVRPGWRGMLVPQMSALQKTTTAYHEAAGYLWYWLTDRL
jgi:uncharacterized SAM-binding protein YcdF (DUF218 family)